MDCYARRRILVSHAAGLVLTREPRLADVVRQASITAPRSPRSACSAAAAT